MFLIRILCVALMMAALFIPRATYAVDEKTLEELEDRWKKVCDDIDMSGVSIVVVKGDKVIYLGAFGDRSKTPEAPYTPDTSSYIASITKTFVGTAIMQLAEQGKIDLDAPVKKYLSRFTLVNKELAETITVRDLLCHRQGLSNSVITFAEAYTGVWDDDFYYSEMAGTGATEEWQYTNLHFTILGRVIQAVTGQTWQDYLADHIFAPLGMSHSTAYASVADTYDDVAYPLAPKEDGGWENAPMRKVDTTMHAAGGIYASTRDMGQWIKLFLNDGIVDGKQILKPETIQAMLTEEVQPRTSFWKFKRDRMGLAWYLGEYNGELMVHHFGSYNGFHAHCSFMPQHDLGVAVLTNNGAEQSMLVHQMAADVYDFLLGLPGDDDLDKFLRRVEGSKRSNDRAREKREPLSDAKLTVSRPLAEYAGHYTSDRWGTMDIRVEGDTLVGSIGNIPLTLHAKETDVLEMGYPLGREEFTFELEGNKVQGATIRSYAGYALRYTKTD